MEDEIRKASAACARAVSGGDVEGAAALYASDAKLLAPAVELIAGRNEIEAYWRAGLLVGVSRLEFETQELELVEALAIEIGRYLVSVQADGGEPVADRGTYLVLHRQQSDGSWRRAVDVFNPDGSSAARRFE